MSSEPITIEEAAVQIERQIDMTGSYSHNIVSLVLAQVAREHGQDVADALISDWDLGDIFGIWGRTRQKETPNEH